MTIAPLYHATTPAPMRARVVDTSLKSYLVSLPSIGAVTQTGVSEAEMMVSVMRGIESAKTGPLRLLTAAELASDDNDE